MDKKRSKAGWRHRFTKWGTVMACTQTLAAIFDLAENRAIVVMLKDSVNGSVADPWPLITSILAGIKWTLIAIGLGYFLWAVYSEGFESTSPRRP